MYHRFTPEDIVVCPVCYDRPHAVNGLVDEAGWFGNGQYAVKGPDSYIGFVLQPCGHEMKQMIYSPYQFNYEHRTEMPISLRVFTFLPAAQLHRMDEEADDAR